MSNPGVSNCYVFKSRLQEYAQKVGLPTPVYETVKEGPSHLPSFRSTVVLDDLRYDSLLGFFNRKAAEQSAAEVALMELANIGKLNDCVSQPVQETGLCKNLLQEYAQKMNYAIPLYVCQRDESQGRVILFSCTVDVGGMKYIGAAAKTKKEAEIKAARTALLAIQSSPGSNETSTGNSVYTVIPSKKMGTDPGISTPENLKPKKGLLKKKPYRKRRDGKKGNSMAMGHLGLGIDIGGHEGQQMAQTANSEVSSMEAAMNPEGGPKSELSSVEATMNLEGGPKSELSSVEATMNPEGGPIYNGNEVEISATEESDMVPCNNVDSKDGKLQDLSMEATMNPEGRPVYSANEVEEFATEESGTEEFATEEGRPVACSNVDPVDGKLQDLGFWVSVLKNPNGGDSTSEVSGVKQNSCNSGGGFDGEQLQDLGFCVSVLKNPNGGDSTSEVSEVKQNSCNSGGGFDGKQLFFHVSMCQGEEPRVVEGLTQTACGGGTDSKQE